VPTHGFEPVRAAIRPTSAVLKVLLSNLPLNAIASRARSAAAAPPPLKVGVHANVPDRAWRAVEPSSLHSALRANTSRPAKVPGLIDSVEAN